MTCRKEVRLWHKCDMCGEEVALSVTSGHPAKWTVLRYEPFPDTNSTPATYDMCPACSREFEAWRNKRREMYE